MSWARRKGCDLCSTIHGRRYSSTYPFKRITSVRNSSIDVFRDEFFKPGLPGFLSNEVFPFKEIPAFKKWFTSSENFLNLNYLERYADNTFVPLELTRSQRNDKNHIVQEFERFDAPLRLFLESLQLMEQREDKGKSQEIRLYLAQASISDFPPRLQDDIPVPSLVLKTGKGDIYNANIWMGLPPTNTPLHCDSNPNLFIQLAGRKKVRLLPPSDGSSVFRKVRKLSGISYTSDVIRGDEMMHGIEKRLLDDLVWDDNESNIALNQSHGIEAELGPGDGLFIPQRWWHSIKSAGTSFTASVNWWFR